MKKTRMEHSSFGRGSRLRRLSRHGEPSVLDSSVVGLVSMLKGQINIDRLAFADSSVVVPKGLANGKWLSRHQRRTRLSRNVISVLIPKALVNFVYEMLMRRIARLIVWFAARLTLCESKSGSAAGGDQVVC